MPLSPRHAQRRIENLSYDLQSAIVNEDAVEMQATIDKGADTNRPCEGVRPMELAAAFGNTDTITLLAENKADVTQQDVDTAVRMGKTAAAKLLKSLLPKP